jgi:hypothetical protein
MPAPSQPAIYNSIKGNLPGVFKNPSITAQQDDWLNALAGKISGAWSDWQNGIEGGGLEVCGSGLGTWTGTGEGGDLTEGPKMEWGNPKPGWPTEVKELNDALVRYTKPEFNDWVSAYSFDSASYEGTTTATSNSSGTFDAEAVGTEDIATIGSGDPPAPIQPSVVSDLKAAGWRPDKSVAKIKEWIGAYDDMIQEQFQLWLDSTLWIDNTVQGPSAAGSGSGCGTSNNDGALD